MGNSSFITEVTECLGPSYKIQSPEWSIFSNITLKITFFFQKFLNSAIHDGISPWNYIQLRNYELILHGLQFIKCEDYPAGMGIGCLDDVINGKRTWRLYVPQLLYSILLPQLVVVRVPKTWVIGLYSAEIGLNQNESGISSIFATFDDFSKWSVYF